MRLLSRTWLLLCLLGVFLCTPLFAEESPCLSDPPRLREIVKYYAERTGTKFVLDPRVSAKPELYGINFDHLDFLTLVGIFNVHGYVAIEWNDAVYVLPTRGAEETMELIRSNKVE